MIFLDFFFLFNLWIYADLFILYSSNFYLAFHSLVFFQQKFVICNCHLFTCIIFNLLIFYFYFLLGFVCLWFWIWLACMLLTFYVCFVYKFLLSTVHTRSCCSRSSLYTSAWPNTSGCWFHTTSSMYQFTMLSFFAFM